MRNRSLLKAVLALALLGMAGTLRAQSATGQITGTVTDQSGAPLAGAKVTVHNDLTGLNRETTSGPQGNYTFPLLPGGAYSVTAEQAGFRLAKKAATQLSVDQVLRVDLQLTVGEVTEVIEVQAGGAAIDTDTATIGQVISEKQITDLPLNGRNFLQLLFLGAGAVETTGEQAGMRSGVGNAISIMGSRPTSNNFMIDGTSNIDTTLGTPAAILSVDAMAEFKEQTKTYSAEYGFSANQINIVSKSGSNEWHGALFGFMRDEKLDAKNFFDSPTAEKPVLDQKQFGGVVTGPIIKNKTFFLLNYEGSRQDRGASAFFIVPNPDELAGRFTTTIIDPLTGQPFPNNTIPTSRFSRLAQLVLRNHFYPAPNISAPQGNYQDVRTLATDQDQFTVRIDQDLGRYGRAFGRFTKTTYTSQVATNYIGEPGDRFFDQETRNWQVSHTWPIQNTLVNQLRVGRIIARGDQRGAACPQGDIDFLGLTGTFTNPDPPEQMGCPGVGIRGFANAGGPVNDFTPSNQPMWDVSNTTTWVKGNHTLNFGANFRKWQLQRDLTTDYLGNWDFQGNITGNPVADFLLGFYQSTSVFQPGGFTVGDRPGNPREFNMLYVAPYIQDDWKVSSRLTLNLGLRWDYRSVPYETNDRMAWRNLDFAPGGLLVADQTLVDRGIVDGAYYQFAGRRSPENPDRYKAFSPRLGFAWRPTADERTVIRGGYGIFYDSAEGREIDGSSDVYPYTSRGAYNNIPGQKNLACSSPILFCTSDQMFPAVAGLGVARPAYNGFLAVSMSPEPRNPKMHQWSLSVQREVARNTVVELNYVGSKGSNLLMRRNIAQAFPNDANNPTSVAARRPFPNFGFYIDSDWNGTSKYNALNTKVEHRGRGLLLTMAYTYGKSTDSKSAAAGIGASAFNGWQGFLDNHHPERDYGRSDFDVKHRFVSSFVWNLPFGKGERYSSDASGLKNAIVGGWQINGIYTYQTGFPLTIQAADVGCLNDLPFCTPSNRADLIGDPDTGGGTINQWFNTSAFAQPAAGHLGSSGRNILDGPGLNNFDLALFKNFDLTRGARLQFRLESFNALNHPQFDQVTTNITNANFGVVTRARAGRINQLGLKIIW